MSIDKNLLCILLKNNSSRYNFLSKITRTDVALSLNSQNAQRVDKSIAPIEK
jgi:hypothetical protein